MGKLTAIKARALKEPGRYTDGQGLMLVIGTDGSRKWVARLQASGKRRDFGLGSASDVSLADARDATEQLRKALKDGRDPIAEREAAKTLAEAEKPPTFREAAKRVHDEHRPSWRNAKHAAQWLSTLETYAFPALGDKPVDQITGPMVRDVLAEIWLTIPETARRVRQRIGAVLDWAHAKGYRTAEAPLRAISKGLPRQPKGQEHFAAMPWRDVPAFLATLDEGTGAIDPVKQALRFVILTAARSGEVRGARWSEIDEQAREWRIPASRMKAGKSHVVPLSDAALSVVSRMREIRRDEATDGLMFEGRRRGRPLSDMALTMLLRRLALGVTAHGFRSSFREWAAEATSFPRELAEASLAHTVGNRVEQAYMRSDLLEKRRKLMEAWAGFCVASGGKVVPIAGRKKG